jgi:transposase
MPRRLSEDQWILLVQIFRASHERRGAKGGNDRRFLEALHHLAFHNVSWRMLPIEFGNWNSVWKRYWRLRQAGVWETFLEVLSALNQTAHLVRMFELISASEHLGDGDKKERGKQAFNRASHRSPRKSPAKSDLGGTLVALASAVILLSSVHLA